MELRIGILPLPVAVILAVLLIVVPVLAHLAELFAYH